MLKLKNNTKIMEISKDTVVSFYNNLEDLLCVFVVQINGEEIEGNYYVFNVCGIKQELDFSNAESMIDLIQTGNPFLLSNFSNKINDNHSATLLDSNNILNSLEFDVVIETEEQIEDEIIYN